MYISAFCCTVYKLEYSSESYPSSWNSVKIRSVSTFLSSALFHIVFRPNRPSSDVENVLDASRCFIQVMLHHTFVSNHVFSLYLLNMLLLFLLVLILLGFVLSVFRVFFNILNKHKPKTWLDARAWHNIIWLMYNTSKGKQSRPLKQTFYIWWWPVWPKHVMK